MNFLEKLRFEGYVSDLSEENYSNSIFKILYQSHDFAIAKATLGNIEEMKGKKICISGCKWKKKMF